MFYLNYKKPKLIYIPIKDILPAFFKSRSYFETTRLDELSLSIKRYGVLQPVLVRKVGRKYEIIAGERRLRAAYIAGLEKIPAILREMSDDEAASCSIMENLQRENLTYLEESDSLCKLAENTGYNLHSLSYAICKNKDKVEEKIRFKKLSKDVRRSICYHKIPESHAKQVLRLTNDEMKLKVISKIVENNYDYTQTKELIEKLLIGEIPTVHTNKKYNKGDMRLFKNTMKRLVDMMKQNGFRAISSEKDDKDFYEYTIRVKKEKKTSA